MTGSPGRQLRIVGVIALLCASTAVLARPPSAWDGLAESAALKVGTTARQLARTAGEIARDGRVGRLSVLRSDAEELVRRTDALTRMTREPLPEGELATGAAAPE
ncbi:MAG: hypothetical protein ACK4YP_11625 [Myxococcota bacterium]